MRLGWILVLVVPALLTSTGVCSAIVGTRQTYSTFDNDGTRTLHSNNLGRSLRTTKESDQSEGATAKKDSIGAEERLVLNMKWKQFWWKTFHVSTNRAKEKLGLKNIYGPALEREEAFPAYLSYVNKIEKNKMWKDAHKRQVPTTDYWLTMEEKFGAINTLEKLE
ncbi:RxLR effector protein [Phytophthora megakarya]|uniref:RxLR effector protein n=1 Tax=Phytophthora megakarya TaxID=4795 RepID=A0A225VY59_9STRA|nr:RxLR effector protein [Phytophthora megakarya]